jgi:hypothetical protein
MPPGKKFGGKDFKKGNPGGPGRPPTSPELKAAKKLTAERFEECVHRLTAMSRDDLNKFINSPAASNLEIMIAGQIRAASQGKTTPISFLLDRTIGTVKHKLDLNVSGSLSHDLQSMTEEQKDALLAELESRAEDPTI